MYLTTTYNLGLAFIFGDVHLNAYVCPLHLYQQEEFINVLLIQHISQLILIRWEFIKLKMRQAVTALQTLLRFKIVF